VILTLLDLQGNSIQTLSSDLLPIYAYLLCESCFKELEGFKRGVPQINHRQPIKIKHFLIRYTFQSLFLTI
jgi:hypothetical protein